MEDSFVRMSYPRQSAMHGLLRSDHMASESSTYSLMTETNAKDGYLSFLYDFCTYSKIGRVVGASWSGGDDDVVEVIAELAKLLVAFVGVIIDHLRFVTIDSSEEMEDIVRVAIVVIDE